ncbi:MAG: double-strand break repair protein AddB, partial [Bradyrhizobium sp.]|nr:double-strand break repair protein AddB [Bradyrhizobium sp.]
MSLPDLIDRLRAAAAELAGDELWRGPAGRALAEIVLKLEQHGGLLDPFAPPDAPGLLGAFFDETAVRPPFGRHPRLAVYGVLEARLQRADLVILGGLNEGVWPAATAPDPWLAPAARARLGLPGLERRVGLAAHDFVQAMGAVEVLVTRARRDASAPTVPSRFWLRLEALGGDRLKKDG